MLNHSKKLIKRLSIALAISFCLAIITPNQVAHAIDTVNSVPVGKDGYLSAHVYASPTNQKDVYKIEVSIEMQVETKPLTVVLVMDETGSMRHVASNDPKDPVTKNFQPRWNLQLKQYNDILDILGDKTKNADYDSTYVAVVSYDGYAMVRTSNGLDDEPSFDPQNPNIYSLAGHTLEQIKPSDQLSDPLLPEFPALPSDPVYPSIISSPIDLVTRLSSYKTNELHYVVNSNNTRYGGKTGDAGFVKISDSETKLRKTIPKLPYLSYGLAKEIYYYDSQNAWPSSAQLTGYGVGWFFEGMAHYGSRSAVALYEAYHLLTEVNKQAPNADKKVILFSDNLEDLSGPQTYYNNMLFNIAALIKAPKNVNVFESAYTGILQPGAEAELMTVGVGFDSFDDSVFPGGGVDQNWYRLVDDRGGMSTMSYSSLEHKNDWSTNYKTWANSLSTKQQWYDTGSASWQPGFPYAQHILMNVPGFTHPTNPGGGYNGIYCDDVWDFCSPYMEPQLVALGAPLDNEVMYGDPSAPSQNQLIDEEEKYHDYFRFYSDNAKYENNKIVSNYDYIDSVNSTVPMFQNLVRTFMNSDSMSVNLKISDSFKLYGMDGHPMLETSLKSSSASHSGQNIAWKIDDNLPVNELGKLVFYVKVTNKVDNNVMAPVFESGSITYTRNGLLALGESTAQKFNVMLGFSSPYISISSGEIQNENSFVDNSADDQSGNNNGSNSNNSGLIPMFVGSASGLKVHTPSVTPTKEIVSETLQEGNIETEIPSTNTSGSFATVSFCFLLAVGALVLIYSRKKSSK